MSQAPEPLSWYAVPGLGVDGRIFGRLTVPMERLEWLEPLDRKEPLEAYALRMASYLPEDRPLGLLGLSFGGILARELVPLRPVKRLLLLSTLAEPAEKPWWLRLFRYLPLYKLSQNELRLKSLPVWAPWFGITDPAEQAFLLDMFAGFSDHYRDWAMGQFVRWEGRAMPIPVARLHGNQDKVFPPQEGQQADWIEGGKHFMVWQKAAAVSAWLEQQMATGEG